MFNFETLYSLLIKYRHSDWHSLPPKEIAGFTVNKVRDDFEKTFDELSIAKDGSEFSFVYKTADTHSRLTFKYDSVNHDWGYCQVKNLYDERPIEENGVQTWRLSRGRYHVGSRAEFEAMQNHCYNVGFRPTITQNVDGTLTVDIEGHGKVYDLS